MTDDFVAEKPSTNPRVLRRILNWSGAAFLLFAIYLLAFLLPDVIRHAGGPESMTLARAAEIANDDNQYAEITDGKWDCETISYVRGRSTTGPRRTITRFTEVFLTDGASLPQSVAFVTFSGEKTCDDLQGVQPEGYLTRMSSSTRQELTDEKRLARYPNAEELMEFCAYCGQDNSLIGTIAGFLFAALGVGLLIGGSRIKVPPQESA